MERYECAGPCCGQVYRSFGALTLLEAATQSRPIGGEGKEKVFFGGAGYMKYISELLAVDFVQ